MYSNQTELTWQVARQLRVSVTDSGHEWQWKALAGLFSRSSNLLSQPSSVFFLTILQSFSITLAQ